MNLNNLNLVELDAQEAKEVEGGNPFAWGFVGALVYEIASNYKSSWTAVKEGYNAKI